jgi:hypothetical protein
MDRWSISLHTIVVVKLPAYKMTAESRYEFDCGYAVTFLNYARTSNELLEAVGEPGDG